MPAPYEKRRLAVDSAQWTAVVVPFNCNSIALKNVCTAALKLRTNFADEGTEDSISSGGLEVLIGPPALDEADCRFPRCRFQRGSVLCYVQPKDGAGAVILTFLQ